MEANLTRFMHSYL